MVCRSVAMDQGLCRSTRTGRTPRTELGRHCGDGQVKLTGASGGGKTAPFGHQEPIGCDAEGRVMVKAAPASSLIVAQSEFLLQFFVVALDDPLMLGQAHQIGKLSVGGQSG